MNEADPQNGGNVTGREAPNYPIGGKAAGRDAPLFQNGGNAAGRDAPLFQNGGNAAGHALTIMLVAGEPSGDQLGAQLMAGLATLTGRAGTPSLRVVGVGGPAMARAGLNSLFPLDVTSVMGLREVVPRIPAILRRVREAADYAAEIRPDLVVVIDSPDFTHRIAQRLKRIDPTIRIANYAPPQVWASRAYRARKMARYCDAVLTMLPFEAPYFERYGIEAYFVGYPVIERATSITGGGAFRERYAIARDQRLLAVLPGSRRSEIRFILPPFRKAVRRLAEEISGLVSVIPTVGHVAHLVRAAAAHWPTPVHVIEGEAEKFSAFDAADAALAASGTVTTELALARTPMVVGYRVGWLTYVLAKPLVRVPYFTLINLTLGREAVPEFMQARCDPQALAAAVKPLLVDEAASAEQIAALEEAMHRLGEGEEKPSLRAARVVLELAARGKV